MVDSTHCEYHNRVMRDMRLPCRRLGGLGHALTVAAIFTVVVAGGCSAPRDSITVDEGMITVENQTDQEWRNVRITVNHHFSGGTAALAPGGRLNAPLSQFQTGFGQKFDRGRQSVFKVEVNARAADGKPVTLTWGADQPK
jgi:hypothetical protein